MADLPTGAAIREARKQQGLTLQVIADRSGFTPAYVCRIERACQQPSVANFVRLADAIGIAPAKILNFACRLKEEGETMARPKKVLLLVDSNEQTLSTRRFTLDNWGYRVLSAKSEVEALEVLGTCIPGVIELMICRFDMPGIGANELVLRARRMAPELRTLIFCDKTIEGNGITAADVFLPKMALMSAELKERVRILLARKRGPKKAPASVVPDDLRRMA